ncbi:unnamed protein product [Hydatigera taeniaeformis]|uniref:Mitochondrial carrier protein n=1 Tax=Hydatigena taeniaeformis TaxID=6205 RepID=A0A0R3WZJ2_HYDTA|nr:unnamed protein product [Hydatigera taeniaeformis]
MVAVAEGLRSCHDFGHFSSYAKTIVVSTMVMRSAVAGPLYALTEKNHALVISAYYQSAVEASNPVSSVRLKDGRIDARLQRSLFQRTFTQNCHKLRCHPSWSALYGMVQLPIWMIMTFGLRNAYWPPMIPEFLTEGLSSPSTSLCLIAATTFATGLNVEITHLKRVYAQTSTTVVTSDPKLVNQNRIANVMPARMPWQLKFAHRVGHLGTILIALFSPFAPSALVIFWCSSASHQLALHLLFLSNRVRGVLGIKKTPVDPKRPYFALWQIAKSHYRVLQLISNRS